MNGFEKICAAVCLGTGAFGLLVGHPIAAGFAKALSGVSFILFFISYLLAHEKMDSEIKAKKH